MRLWDSIKRFFNRTMPKDNKRKPTSLHKNRESQSGTVIQSGVISTDEYVNDLVGRNKVVTYDKMMRSSASVAQVIDLVNQPVRSANYYWEPASDDTRDVEVADFVEKAIFDGMNVSWNAFLEAALKMIPFGFQPFEKVYKQIMWNGQPKYGVDLFSISQKTVYGWEMPDGTYGIHQITETGHECYVPMSDLLLFTFHQDGDNFEGNSILRAAYPHWYHVNTYYNISGMAYERQAMGIPLVKTPPNATKTQKAAAESIAKNIRANNQLFASMPNDFTLEIMDMKGSTVIDPMPLIEHHVTQIFTAALANFMRLGNTPNGSRAVSLDQSTIFEKAEEAIAQYLVDTINKYLVRELVDINFADVKEYPKLCFSDISRDDLEAMSIMLQRLSQAGLITGDGETENYVRRRIKFPEKQTEENNLDRPAELQTEDDETNKDLKTSSAKKKIIAAKRVTGNQWSRPFTASEMKVNFDSIQKKIEHGEAAIRQHLSDLTDQQLDDLLSSVRRGIESGQPMLAFQKIDIAFSQQYEDVFFDDERAIFEYAKLTTADEMEKALGFPVNAPGTTKEEIDKLRAKAASVANENGEKLKNGVVSMATDLVNQQRSADDVVSIVGDAMRDKSEKWIDSTAAASVIGSVNQGRTFTQQENSDKIYAYQYSAILDHATCNTCEALDGDVVDKSDPAYRRLMPPQHFNCRCIWVEILNDEQDKPAITGIPDEIDQDLSINNFKQISDKELNQL